MATSEAVYCPSCGAEEQQGDFCTKCGEQIGASGGRQSMAGGEETAESDAELITGKRLVIVGAAIAGTGAFLPWFTVETAGVTGTVQGIDRDGMFTLVFALLAGALALSSGDRPWNRWASIAVVLLGLLTAFFGGAYIYDPWLGVQESPDEATRSAVQIGIGLYATLIGGVLIAAGPQYDYSKSDDDGQLLPPKAKKALSAVVGLLLGLFVIALLSG